MVPFFFFFFAFLVLLVWVFPLSNFGKLFGNDQNLPKIRKFSETEPVEILLGRASFRTHPKATLVMDYT